MDEAELAQALAGAALRCGCVQDGRRRPCRAAPPSPPWAWCPTMGFLHARATSASIGRAKAECGAVGGQHLRQPDAVRRRTRTSARYPRDLDARSRPAGRRRASDLRLRPEVGRDLPARLCDSASTSGAIADAAGGGVAAGPFRRRRDGGRQAVQHRPADPRLFRPEGRPAVRRDPAHGRATSTCRSRSSSAADGPRSRTASRSPAATVYLTRPSAAHGRPVLYRALVTRQAPRSTAGERTPTSCAGSSPRRWLTEPAVRLDYVSVADAESLRELDRVDTDALGVPRGAPRPDAAHRQHDPRSEGAGSGALTSRASPRQGWATARRRPTPGEPWTCPNASSARSSA